MKWELPRENYFVKKPDYPVFSMLLIILLVFCGAAILELMGWPEGKKFNNEFYIAIAYPASRWSLALLAIITFIVRLLRFDFYATDYLARKGMCDFKNSAIGSLPLIDSSMVLPVEYLSLKIQGIEGEAPISPATPLKIELGDESFNSSRLNNVMVKLLEPLGKQIGKSGNFFNVWIYAKNSDESLSDEVRSVLTLIKAPMNLLKSINILQESPGYDLINTWIDEDFSYQRLFINIELHSDEETTFFENATAFLFDNSPREEDSPVYLLRMMDSQHNKIRETSKVFFSAKQLEPSSLKKIFSCSLGKKEKENLYTALSENKTGVEQDKRYELEKVTGEPTKSQKWVTLALAAEAVQYGQGNQLVAAQMDDKIYVGMLAEKYPGWWREPPDFMAIVYGIISTLIVLIPVWMLISFIADKLSKNDTVVFIFAEVIATVAVTYVSGAMIHTYILDEAQRNMGVYHSDW
ncbi:hypothetical protein EGM70_03805 [Enterobacteriaceae bacterium 89]|nr:hypothetical protein [Enterobacteriaceae bacterium 89]